MCVCVCVCVVCDVCVCVCVCCVWCVWGSGVIGGCHMTAICELCLATDQPWVISHHYVIMCNCSHSDNKCNIFLAVGIKPVSPNHCCTSNKTLSNLVPSPSIYPREKWSGEWSQISRTYSQEVVRTNEIVRSITLAPPTQQQKFTSTWPILSGLGVKCFKRCKVTLTKVCASVRNLLGSLDRFSSWEGGVWETRLYMKSDVGEVDLTNTLVRSVHNVFSSGDEQYTLPSYV